MGLILESEVTVIVDQYQCVKTDCKYLRSKEEIFVESASEICWLSQNAIGNRM